MLKFNGHATDPFAGSTSVSAVFHYLPPTKCGFVKMPFLQKSFIVHSFFARWEDGRSANFTASMASPLLHDTFSASSDAVGWRIICRPCQRVGQRHVPFTLNFNSYLIDLTRTYLIDVSFSFQQLARGGQQFVFIVYLKGTIQNYSCHWGSTTPLFFGTLWCMNLPEETWHISVLHHDNFQEITFSWFKSEIRTQKHIWVFGLGFFMF